MSDYNENVNQRLSVGDVLNYQTVTNASVNSAVGINMANVRRACYFIQVDSLGSAGTVDARLQCSQFSNFASPTNLQGTNLTQINTTTTLTNNCIAMIEVRSDQLAQVNNNQQWVRLNLTGGGNAVTLSAMGLGFDPVQRPGSQYNGTNLVSQQVVCSL